MAGKKGRRSVGISINNDDYGVIGIQLARKHYGVGIYDLSGNEVVRKFVQTETRQSPRKVMDGLMEGVQGLIDGCGERKILAIGMAVPGPYRVDGVVLRNLTIHGEASLRYENLSVAASTPNLFFVMSKSRQFFLVFKDCLTPEQRESFFPFLKERCPKLKIMR